MKNVFVDNHCMDSSNNWHLTRIHRKAIVNENNSLTKIAKMLDIGPYLLLNSIQGILIKKG